MNHAGTGLLNYAMLAVIATFTGQCDVVRDTPWQVRLQSLPATDLLVAGLGDAED
jgi:hypothetical protein